MDERLPNFKESKKMDEQLPLISILISIIALLVAIHPYFGLQKIDGKLRQISESTNSGHIDIAELSLQNLNDGTDGANDQLSPELKRIKREIAVLSVEVKNLRKEHASLSEWTMEQLITLESGKTNMQGNQNFNSSVNEASLTRSGNENSLAQELSQLPNKSGRDNLSESRGSDALIRGKGNWQTTRLEKAISSLNLFPQQSKPVRAIMEDAFAESDRRTSELSNSGLLTGDALAEIKKEIREKLDSDLSSVLTNEQMDSFRNMYQRRNRYTNDTRIHSGNTSSADSAENTRTQNTNDNKNANIPNSSAE